MKIALLAAPWVIGGVAVTAPAQSADGPPVIDASRLRPELVLGRLGQPLGAPTRVVATVEKPQVGVKRVGGDYLLRVRRVDGKPLAKPVDFDFEVDHGYGFGGKPIMLANSVFALHKLRNGENAGALTGPQIVHLERGYVGKTVELAVYEHGVFSGVSFPSLSRVPQSKVAKQPRVFPEGFVRQPRAGTTYRFHTVLVVLAQHQ